MTALSAAYPHILPSAPQCPSITALFHLQQAAVEFFDSTLAWRQTLSVVPSTVGALTLTAAITDATSATLAANFTGPTRNDYTLIFSDGTAQYDVTLTNGSTAVSWSDPVSSAAAISYLVNTYALPLPAGTALTKLLLFTTDGREGSVVSPDLGASLIANNDRSEACWTSDRVNVTVNPAPQTAGIHYMLTVALKPTQAATTLDDQMFEDYGADIATGALARILMLPKQPWTDMNLGAAKRGEFVSRMNTAALRAAKGYGRARMRVRAHTF